MASPYPPDKIDLVQLLAAALHFDEQASCQLKDGDHLRLHIGRAEGCGHAEEVVQAQPHSTVLSPHGQDVVIVRPGQAVLAEQGLEVPGGEVVAVARHS